MKIEYLEASVEEVCACWIAKQTVTKGSEEIKSWKYYFDAQKNKVIYKLNIDKKAAKVDKPLENIKELKPVVSIEEIKLENTLIK